MPAVSVVIPFFDGATFLAACLKSLADSGFPLSSVTVVRNSPAEKPPLPERLLAGVEVIDLGGPVGYARAVNVGVQAAREEYVCLCDADAFVDAACIETLVAALSQQSEIRFCGPTLIDPGCQRVIDSGIGLRRHGHFHPWLGRTREELEAYGRDHEIHPWPAICSAVMAFRQSDFLDVGGMDPSYVDFLQDVDFCLRAGALGKKAGIVTGTYAYHSGRSSGVHHPPGQIDMVAHHFGRHGAHWNSGVVAWLRQQINIFKRERAFPVDAFWADLSTLADSDEFLQVVQDERVQLIPLSSVRPRSRDLSEINLFHHLNYEAVQASLPVIYFADSCRSLEPNQYWMELRAGRGDIIIDRHCNVVALDRLRHPRPLKGGAP